MILILATMLLGGAAFCALDVVTAPRRERRVLLRRAAAYGRVRRAAGRERPPFRARVVEPVATRLAAAMLRLNPRQTVDDVAARLIAAGLRHVAPRSFLAARAACGLGGLALGALVGGASSPLMLVLLAGALGTGGFVAPSMWVSARASRRRTRLLADLPDALDLLAVSVEAGMGFDGAIAKLCERMEGPLAEEFELALGEMRVGESRHDALRRMAERTGVHELASFVRSLIQADQLGTSLGRILRVQANDMRLKQQLAAEEKAMKAPIKMLFPTMLFIFPSMFVVVLGPAILSLGKVLGF